MDELSDKDRTKLKNILCKRQQELERLITISQDSRQPVELDQTRQGRVSRQDALMQQEMAKETNRRRVSELQRISVALDKIEGDDYGYCVKCDDMISIKRLELDPSISLCINCAGT
jgi:DnaK suppressor protein